MKARDLERLKKILLEQKANLLNKSYKFKVENKEGKESGGDEADIATSEMTLSLDIRLHERERVLIHKIEQALARISEGSYGNCDSCGEGLDVKRLEARPVATLCIACKEEQEDREKVYAFS